MGLQLCVRWFAPALLFLACGDIVTATGNGSDAGTQGDAATTNPCMGGSITLENLAQCLVQNECEDIMRCGTSRQYGTVEECIANPDFEFVLQGLEILNAAFASGDAQFDGEAGAQCLAAIRSKNCNGSSPEICDRVFFGNKGSGASCFTELECGVGGSCEGRDCGSSGDICCAGLCRLPALVGQTCVEGDCVPGAHCAEGTCRTGDDGAVCFENSDCDNGLRCNLGQCKPTAPEGGVCVDDSDCQGTLLCVSGICAVADKPGDRCQNRCRGQNYCGALQQCVALPGPNDPCAAAGACRSIDLICDSSLPIARCVPAAGLDQPCQNANCAAGLYCMNSGILPVCRPRKDVGETCGGGEFDECVSFTCNDETGLCDSVASCYADP